MDDCPADAVIEFYGSAFCKEILDGSDPFGEFRGGIRITTPTTP